MRPLLCLLALALAPCAARRKWHPVGAEGLSYGEAYDVSLALRAGQPVVAYHATRQGPVRVAALARAGEREEWVALAGGRPASPSGAESIGLALCESSGDVLVAFADLDRDGRASVRRLAGGNGDEWQDVGEPGFTHPHAANVQLAVDHASRPHLALTSPALGDRATVLRFDGHHWLAVGGAPASPGAAASLKLALFHERAHGRTVVYAAFVDLSADRRVTVVRHIEHDPAGWRVLGAIGVARSPASEVALVVTDDGVPHVALRRADAGHNSPTSEVKLMRFDAAHADADDDRAAVRGEWSAVGHGRLADGPVGAGLSVAAHGAAVYVGFSELRLGRKMVVKMLAESGVWKTVGDDAISDGAAGRLAIAVAPDGSPIVAYRDDHHGAKVSVRAHHGPPDKAHVGAHAYTLHRSHLDEELLDLEDEEEDDDDWYDDDDDDDDDEWEEDDDDDDWDDDNGGHGNTAHHPPFHRAHHRVAAQSVLAAYRGMSASAVVWVAFGCAALLAFGAKRAQRCLARVVRRRPRRSSEFAPDDKGHFRIPIGMDHARGDDDDVVMAISRALSDNTTIKRGAATTGAPALRSSHSLPVPLPADGARGARTSLGC